MGVFEFIILIVLISTAGKVLLSRSNRPRLPEGVRSQDIDQLNEAVGDLHTRLAKLEEERDFYRALLESPDRQKGLEPPAEGTADES